MRLQNDPPLHLTYCLNIHPGETWAENFEAVRTHALAVKRLVSADRPFGLGLRLSNAASGQLAGERALSEFKAFLDANGLYVFTVNAFPYGAFHGTTVKQDVYRPDWRVRERVDYTNRVADILAALLPEGVTGSISTVPLCYRKRPDALDAIVRNLTDCALRLAEIRARTGKTIVLALEPEPDCTIENTDETVAFFTGALSEAGPRDAVRRHVGVCVDVCHLAVEFENPAQSIDRLSEAGINIAKVQLSSALRCNGTPAAIERLHVFCEPVYLHQVKVRRADGSLLSYDDLEDALRRHEPAEGDEWRVHFHVPLYLAEYGELRSTNALYTPELARLLLSGVTGHLEIETYTFDVLPEAVREADVTRNIVREFEWVISYLGC